MFSVRIVSTDHYMSTPVRGLDVHYAEQRCSEVKKVPVFRIFGSTPAGQKTCMHVHGVFPYLYVPYDGTVPWDRYLRHFATSLDKAINVAQGHSQANLQHVYKIVLVSGKSMYGYHDKEQQFLKIYFYNPSLIKKAADLLLGGAVLNKPFQPHESHIPYTLQLFIDYNLYGMNMINTAAVKFRRQAENDEHEVIPLSQGSDEGFGSDPKTPVSFTGLLNRSGSVTPSQRVWQNENIPSELYLDASVERISTCELEVDVVAADILNRLEVGANIGTNPGLAALWEDERQRRQDRGESTDIAPPESQEREHIEVAESELILRERLHQILLDLQPYMDSQSDTDSEQSQDFPLSQASDVHIHSSQDDDIGGSQDTVMFDEADLEEDKPVVNEESIHRIVSFSQSFCDVRPEIPKVSSQDKSLADILASLADDTSPPSSQNAASQVVALEEQDSILSQVLQPRDDKVDKEEAEEVLVMSQIVWEGENEKVDSEEAEKFDLAGMDDTWIDSQTDSPVEPVNDDTDKANVIDNYDSDSDAASDIIPQYDGPPDQKGDAKRAEAKEALLKRLGMRGPASSLAMPNRGASTFGNMIASNPFADAPSPTQNFNNYPNNPVQQFPGNWNQPGNQTWGRNIPQQNIGMHHSPGAGSSPSHQHHSPGSYHRPQHSPSGGNQYSPVSGKPSYQISPGSQNIHNQYGAGNQSYSQSSPQGQHSPRSYQGQYPTTQGFSPSASQQMSPPYTAQHLHHAQPHSSQSNVPYSQPQTFSLRQNERTHDMNRFMQGGPERFPHSSRDFPQKLDQPHMHKLERGNQREGFPAPTYSIPNQVNISQGHLMSMANQPQGLQSHDVKRSIQNQSQIQPHNYGLNSSHSSQMIDIQNQYQQDSAGITKGQRNTSDLPSYTAQALSAGTGSSSHLSSGVDSYQGMEQPSSGFDARRSNPSMHSNQIVPNLIGQGISRRGRGRGRGQNSRSMMHTPGNPENFMSSPEPQNKTVRQFLSNPLLQRRQKTGSMGEFPDPLCVQSGITNVRPETFGRQISNEAGSYTHMNDNSPKGHHQLSPRTPSGDSGMQSPGSASSKLSVSEPFVGPVTKYFQRRLMYEQISPPATPISATSSETSKKSQAAFSPSGNLSDQQVSPLQKLLLDTSDLPLSRSDQKQRTSSRSSISSLSSVSSEKPHNLSQFEGFMPSRYNHEKSRLYNLLSSKKNETESVKEAKNVENTQASLNDSQQDLFPDSLLSEIGSGENNTADSLSSLFSDDGPMKTAVQQEGGVTASNLINKSGAQTTKSKDDFASLSSLESFVGSVRNETSEFGVNFNKTSSTDQFIDSVVSDNSVKHNIHLSVSSARTVTSNNETMRPMMTDSQENISRESHIADSQQTSIQGPSPGTQNTFDTFPQAYQSSRGRGSHKQSVRGRGRGHSTYHQSPNRSYNLTDWPQYSIQPGQNVVRGRGQRRRGRPPVKKVEPFGVVQKKKRGRPRKIAENFTLPSNYQQQSNLHSHAHSQIPSVGSQFSQQLQNQYSIPHNVDMPPNVDPYKDMDMNMPYYQSQTNNQSQSFSQLLEGDNNDLLSEFSTPGSLMGSGGSNFDGNVGIQQENQPLGNQFPSETNFNMRIPPSDNQFSVDPNQNQALENFSQARNQNQQDIAAENFQPPAHRETTQQTFQGQPYTFQQQPQQPFHEQQFDTQQQLSTINLSEAMQISEPQMNFSTDLSDLSNEDLSQILPEIEAGQSSAINQKSSDQSMDFGDIDTNLPSTSQQTNLKTILKKKTQHPGGGKGRPDTATIMELIRYRQRTELPLKMSAAYKFRFKVPTPVFKRLKFRVKKNASEVENDQLDFVRMHPKDARKYSLLKIGREIIQLKKLSENMINEIKETLKSGEDVSGIPPPVRVVSTPAGQQAGSIIADLLSADSPHSNEMIRTGDVEEVLNDSFPQGILDNTESFMVKNQNRLSLSKDKKPNSMFRGKNIATIPHLKKYRAGFPYFGKGHVGRGGSHNTKMKANNKGLKPEYEDDENIILKDVCLNDGILTPIKSRTPVAGRSPAHYGGGSTVPEIENQVKNILETKLKDLEYDLDLNQSGNAQMFQDVLMGEKELQNKTEFENSDEEMINKDEKEKMKGEKFENTDEESSVKDADEKVAKIVEKEEKIEYNKVKMQESELEAKENVENENGEKLEFPKMNDQGCDNKTVSDNSIEVDLKIKNVITSDDGDVNSREKTSKIESLKELKKQIEKQLENDRIIKMAEVNGIVNKADKHENKGTDMRRSRSSSRDSQVIPSRTSSRRNSVILSGMSGDEEKCFWSAGSIKRCQSSDGSDSCKNDSRRVKKSRTYGSSTASSRKSSRSSSLDQDSIRKKCKSKKKNLRKSYRYDSDSDGIPGVDYIVVNRFKGRKELRVVVEKLQIDKDVDIVNDQNKNGISSKMISEQLRNSGDEKNESKNDIERNNDISDSKCPTGYSEEFEKFLASKSEPVDIKNESDSDTEGCDFPDIVYCVNSGDKNKYEDKAENIVPKNNLSDSYRTKCDGTEFVDETEKECDKLSNIDLKCMDYPDRPENDQNGQDLTEDVGEGRQNGCSSKHEGTRDISSSSEEEKILRLTCVRPKNGKKNQLKFDSKKKRASKSIHDGSVFCSRGRKKRQKPKKVRPSKLMCSLSALHDATLEKLTSFPVFGEVDTGNSSSSQSPAKSRDISDIDSPVRWQPRMKTPDFELYLDKTDDHVSHFEDTLYKLAYLSPMSSDTCCDSPPRPLSPKEMSDIDNTQQGSNEKTAEHNEKKMTISDILKKMQGGSEGVRDTEASTGKETPGTPSKIAVAKIEALTFNDIKSFCLSERDNEEKNKEQKEEKRPDSLPPDLGPPVLESEKDKKAEEGSPPPKLSPKRIEQSSDGENISCVESNFSESEGNGNTPPFLIPCRSPRIALSPRYSSPRAARGCNSSEAGDYFSIPIDRDSVSRTGRSPGACSSSGSINVIHSEEFSDISDENDSDIDSGIRKRNRIGKPKYTDSPTMPNLSPRVSTDYSGHHKTCRNSELEEKEMKLREIQMFEDRLRKADEKKRQCEQDRLTSEKQCPRKADENKNNIFDLMSGRYALPLSELVDQKLKAEAIANRYPVRDKSSVPIKERLKNGYSEEIQDLSNAPKKDNVMDMERLRIDSMLKTDFSRNSQNKNVFQNLSPSFSVYRNEHRNGELDFFKPIPHLRNGEINRSLSHNDVLMSQYKSFMNSKAYQNMSMDLNRAALERNSPSNGKHLSDVNSPKNLFESFNFSHPGSEQGDKGINSGDLFESCSEGSSRHSFPSFTRSMSENGRTDYGIVRNNKFSDSIMRSVQNYAKRDKNQIEAFHTPNCEVPFFELGGGEGKRKINVNAQSGSSQASSSSQRRSSHPSGSDDFNGNHGNKDQGKGQRYQTFEESRPQTGCHVITPHKAPPSIDSILESANQHGLAAFRPTGAFYSNYGDVPEKPREGGGHILKLPSTLVKDLVEFDTSALILSSSPPSSSSPSSLVTGIKNWRTILCAKDSLLSSQTGSTDLLYRLENEPALKYAITGDQSIIITPCSLPPSLKTVQKWYERRKEYQKLKNRGSLKEETNEKKGASEERIEKVGVSSKEVVSETEKIKISDINKFTAREFTKVTPRRKTDTKIHEEKGINVEATIENVNVKSPSADLDDLITSPGQSQSQDTETNLLHSTPVLRRGSTDLFEPECTPITGEKRAGNSQGEQGSEFTTPKRIRPIRRLSTHTDSTLRRAILSSQAKQQFGTPSLHRRDTSQIEGPSLKNSFGFKHSQQNLQDAKALHEYQYLTVLSVEIHAETRGDLKPDPEVDGIMAIFYSVFNDVHPERGTRHQSGVFIVDPASANENADDKLLTNQKMSARAASPQPGPSKAPDTPKVRRSQVIASTSKDIALRPKTNRKETLLEKSGVLGLTVTYVKDENELLHNFIGFVHSWNPDILVGYEIQMLSWGYILQRASHLSINLTQAISRIPSAKNASHHSKEHDQFGADYTSEIHISGRIVLNLWRLLRHEVTLNVYSFENIAFHVLHKRIPLFSFRNLTAWFKHRTHLHRWKVIEHYATRVKANIEIMDQLDMVGRTSEFARVFGIEFYHVLSRGSQYRVESMMLRVAKPMNYIPVSPSVQQRARMKAPECIPLTLEPESKFYTDPVVVVDFQSLYPSIMIAYNYCFSTCLGRVEWFKNAHEGPIEFGCTSLGLDPSVIKKLTDDVTISPNGVVFCKQSVKRGVLPIMVEEILKTRLMVKKGMSSYKDDKTLSRMLNARQLGLKLIANVTYGYTGANFSGRMPCIEVGDSIVRKARETLERSIKLIEDTPRWGARVVYGDTDSMFIELKGRSKDEAFKIGQDIAKSVTAMFPKPIKLKFEKVYLPCVLQTKKRYVGFMYETPDQKEPVYDAKGIETVRRDTCSAVAKVLERSLKILFTTKDVSQVKSYIQQQCQKVMEGSVSLQDFVFAKEYRGMPGYKPGACVPALEIAKKCLRQDRRSEPRVGERVPYVIVYGSPGLPLIQLVRTPSEVLQDPSLRLNSTYYITKQILPPLDRFLSLMGANVFSWYQEMPHSAGRVVSHIQGPEQAKKGTISQYFVTSNCPTCDKQTKKSVCERCMLNPQLVCMTLNDRITRWERVHRHLQQICGTCVGTSDLSTISACITLDCPVRYRRARASSDMIKSQSYRDILEKIFQ